MSTLKNQTLYYKVLDYLFPNWEHRIDNYYYVELAALLRDDYKINKLQRTITRNLREGQIDEFTEAFEKILQKPKAIFDYYFEHRLKPDRLMANKKRYLYVNEDWYNENNN